MEMLLMVVVSFALYWPVQSGDTDTPKDQPGGIFRKESPSNFLIYGPGLNPTFTVPYRYFFIQVLDSKGDNFTESVGLDNFKVEIKKSQGWVRAGTELFDRNNGSYIVVYRLMATEKDLEIHVRFAGNHVGGSPFLLKGVLYDETCDCPDGDYDRWMNTMECPREGFAQIHQDLQSFGPVDIQRHMPQFLSRFVTGKNRSTSFVHYVIKDNQLYRKTHGEYVGFKMFSDDIFLSLMRKVKLPDVELFLNLGDYPMERRGAEQDPIPIFSWCGSTDTRDIIMPTYKMTKSTLSRGGVTVFSVQGNTGPRWENKSTKAFFRGRDSSRERLELVRLARRRPDIIDAHLTHLFFFRDEADIQQKDMVKPVSFYEFFKHKYQLNLDGTVAAYRLPHLLAGDSVVLKQESTFYEHFYRELQPYVHYIPIARDLSDLEEKLEWAKSHDQEVKVIAQNAQNLVNKHLLPAHIYCYYGSLLKEYSKKLVNIPVVADDMEKVSQPTSKCRCERRQNHENSRPEAKNEKTEL